MYGYIDHRICLIEKIGEGGTSEVYLASWCNDSINKFAVKIMKSKSSKQTILVDNEIEALKLIKHKNIINYFEGGKGVLTLNSGKMMIIYYVAIELMENNDMFKYVYYPHKGFDEVIAKYIFIQVLDALEACHNSGIVHRDIKLENIMLSSSLVIKLADFGYSTQSSDNYLLTNEGTTRYACPEILNKIPHNGVKADIFSLGVALFIAVTGNYPFKYASSTDVHYSLIMNMDIQGYWGKLAPCVSHLSEECKDLFIRLVSFNPSLRPSIEEIRNHSWIRNYSFDLEYIHKEFYERKQVIAHEKELEIKKNEFREKLKKLAQMSNSKEQKCNGSSKVLASENDKNNRIASENGSKSVINIGNGLDPVRFFRRSFRVLRSNRKFIVAGNAGRNFFKVQLYTPLSFSEVLVKLKKKKGSIFVILFKRLSGSKSNFKYLNKLIQSAIL